MKKKTTAILIVILASAVGYYILAANHAKSRVEGICSAIRLDTSFSAAEKAVSDAGIPERLHPSFLQEYLSKSPPDRMMIVIPSPFAQRWVCAVSFSQGRVIEKDVRLLD